MRSAAYCKRMFTIAAIWNWGIAALFAASAALELELLAWFITDTPQPLLWFYLFLGCVFALGCGYYWIGQDAQRNRAIIKMGVLAKLIVVALVVPAWLNGVVTILGASAAVVDFIFTLLFLDVLMKNPDAPAHAGAAG